MENVIKNWEIFGIFFIIILGSIFHFLFELTGYNLVIAAFTAVNESVWEHLKLAFFPLFLFSMIEYNFIKHATGNFLIAKAVASYGMPLLIISIFYSYSAILGDNLLVLDMLTFVIAVVIGQLLSYRILLLPEKSKSISYISLISIILLTMIFVFFTYYPPQLPIFQDSTNGSYGIVTN